MADCRLILGENRKRSRKDGGGVDQDWHKNQPIGLSLPSDSGTMDAENLGSTGYEEMMAAALKTDFEEEMDRKRNEALKIANSALEARKGFLIKRTAENRAKFARLSKLRDDKVKKASEDRKRIEALTEAQSAMAREMVAIKTRKEADDRATEMHNRVLSEQLAAGYKKLDENRAKTKNEPWKQNLDKLERDIAELQEQEAEIDRQTAELRRKLVSVKTECEEEITMEEFVVQMSEMALKKQKAEKDINRYRYLIKMGNLKLKRMKESQKRDRLAQVEVANERKAMLPQQSPMSESSEPILLQKPAQTTLRPGRENLFKISPNTGNQRPQVDPEEESLPKKPRFVPQSAIKEIQSGAHSLSLSRSNLQLKNSETLMPPPKMVLRATSACTPQVLSNAESQQGQLKKLHENFAIPPQPKKFEGSPGRSRHSSTSSVVSTAELLESYKKSQLQRENARRLKLTAKRLSPHTKPSRTPVKQLAHPPHSSHPFPISEPQNLLVTSGTFVSQPNSTVEELSDGFDEYPANFESQEPASQPDSIFGGASQQRGLTSFDQYANETVYDGNNESFLDGNVSFNFSAGGDGDSQFGFDNEVFSQGGPDGYAFHAENVDEESNDYGFL